MGELMSELMPLDMSSPDIWGNPRFHQLIIEGLEHDGYGPDAVRPVKMALELGSIRSNEELFNAVQRMTSDLPAEQRRASDGALAYLRRLAADNEASYRMTTPEEARTLAWPNAPESLGRDPEMYFDIYEDLFYRHRYPFITPQTPIGSAGSCFATRIAHQLQEWKYNYVIEEDDLPEGYPIENLGESNYRMAPARVGTLFNVPSMQQMVERAFGVREPDKLLSSHSDGSLLDPFRYVPAQYTDFKGYLADYDRHTVALRRALMRCDVFIFTLGLTEAWYFAHSGDYTTVTPYNRINPLLLRMKLVSVEENIAALENIYALYRRHRPDVKFIISVSPIPLRRSFSKDHHVVVANNLSKATLIVAAHQFIERHPTTTFYFPAYEMVTYGTKEPWEADRRHVTAEAVGRVMALFRRMFLAE